MASALNSHTKPHIKGNMLSSQIPTKCETQSEKPGLLVGTASIIIVCSTSAWTDIRHDMIPVVNHLVNYPGNPIIVHDSTIV